jgi:hypothetical protein
MSARASGRFAASGPFVRDATDVASLTRGATESTRVADDGPGFAINVDPHTQEVARRR